MVILDMVTQWWYGSPYPHDSWCTASEGKKHLTPTDHTTSLAEKTLSPTGPETGWILLEYGRINVSMEINGKRHQKPGKYFGLASGLMVLLTSCRNQFGTARICESQRLSGHLPVLYLIVSAWGRLKWLRDGVQVQVLSTSHEVPIAWQYQHDTIHRQTVGGFRVWGFVCYSTPQVGFICDIINYPFD